MTFRVTAARRRLDSGSRFRIWTRRAGPSSTAGLALVALPGPCRGAGFSSIGLGWGAGRSKVGSRDGVFSGSRVCRSNRLAGSRGPLAEAFGASTGRGTEGRIGNETILGAALARPPPAPWDCADEVRAARNVNWLRQLVSPELVALPWDRRRESKLRTQTVRCREARDRKLRQVRGGIGPRQAS